MWYSIYQVNSNVGSMITLAVITKISILQIFDYFNYLEYLVNFHQTKRAWYVVPAIQVTLQDSNVFLTRFQVLSKYKLDCNESLLFRQKTILMPLI